MVTAAHFTVYCTLAHCTIKSAFTKDWGNRSHYKWTTNNFIIHLSAININNLYKKQFHWLIFFFFLDHCTMCIKIYKHSYMRDNWTIICVTEICLFNFVFMYFYRLLYTVQWPNCICFYIYYILILITLQIAMVYYYLDLWYVPIVYVSGTSRVAM